MMNTPFSNRKFPPAPILNIRLGQIEEPPSERVFQALVDTGSDFSLAPRRFLVDLEIPEYEVATVRGLWGPRQQAMMYIVDIHLEDRVIPAVEIVGVPDGGSAFENEEIILGRNVLNKLILLLEGTKQQTTILERRPLRF